MVKEYSDECNTIDINYPLFFPYNYGKDVCIGLDPNGVCLGVRTTFGNHVGDWEHAIIRFQSGKPVAARIGAHSFGAKYSWDEENRRFTYYYGKPTPLETREIKYPQYIFMSEGNHMEVFAANGSHGVWSAEGKFNYFNLIIHLEDFTDRGELWKTEENMVVWDTTAEYNTTSEMNFVNFQGLWGNIKKMVNNLNLNFSRQ